jgi:hypothetical protein
MKRTIQFFIWVFLISSSIIAQEKLKGNKEVTIQNRNISNFNKIEVIDNIEVVLSYNQSQSVKVETDSNLQDAVLTETENGILTIKISDRITRKKELKVHLNVNDNLKEINGYNNSKIISKSLLNIDSLTINAFDNADVELKLNSKIVSINSKKTSDLKLEILTNELIVRAEESSKIKATANSKESIIEVLDRATFIVDGSTTNFELTTLGNASFKGREFESISATVKVSNDSKAFVNVTKNLNISAINSSEIYIYSNPKIILSEFFDKASIHKRLLDKKLF